MLFEEGVEITEKLDGSQFRWGIVDGKLECHSKGKKLSLLNCDAIFKPAVKHINGIKHKLLNHYNYYGETLAKSRHNVLTYKNVPENHIALFAIRDLDNDIFLTHEEVALVADSLDIDCVKLLYNGKLSQEEIVNKDEFLEKFVDNESQLGGTNMEGCVIKNFSRGMHAGGHDIPYFMQAKYVADQFRERAKLPKNKQSPQAKWEAVINSYCTEARWDKGIQHLKEEGVLKNSPKDIGVIIKEIYRDITEESKEEILDYLWKTFGNDLLKRSVSGFAPYYLKKLEGE